jgi:hypothetical protein
MNRQLSLSRVARCDAVAVWTITATSTRRTTTCSPSPHLIFCDQFPYVQRSLRHRSGKSRSPTLCKSNPSQITTVFINTTRDRRRLTPTYLDRHRRLAWYPRSRGIPMVRKCTPFCISNRACRIAWFVVQPYPPVSWRGRGPLWKSATICESNSSRHTTVFINTTRDRRRLTPTYLDRHRRLAWYPRSRGIPMVRKCTPFRISNRACRIAWFVVQPYPLVSWRGRGPLWKSATMDRDIRLNSDLKGSTPAPPTGDHAL